VSLIWVINPNTTRAMTSKIEDCARAVVGSGVSVEGITSEIGPESIESHYDEAMSVPGVLDAIRRGERDGVDGYVIACFGDPGLDAARELASGPVIGIAEAAMRTATYLGAGFSVVTTLERTIGQAAHLAERYGMQRFCRGIHACDIPVLGLDTDPDAQKVITEACHRALESDRSDVVVLGCAGMADMCGPISAELGVPVVDGVTAAVLTVQSLVMLDLHTSKRGEYAAPLPKAYPAG
jgi:allantoin racemase